ncbi:MAG: hypothetical protein GY795_08405 [Desulfobacterales bacterium]|nr:hypothetical protein [Desulfobacterales bacterium]
MVNNLSVVDTNVPLTANEKADAGPDCILECIRALQYIMEKGHIVLDDNWLIIKEYMNKLSSTGQPGLGDMFLKWVLTNQSNPSRCTCVPITPVKDNNLNFEEFPDHIGLKNFDLSDRKFVAVSIAHGEYPPILQAVDCKWWGWKSALHECGVYVEFLCPEEIARKYAEKMGKTDT